MIQSNETDPEVTHPHMMGGGGILEEGNISGITIFRKMVTLSEMVTAGGYSRELRWLDWDVFPLEYTRGA